MDGGGGGGGGGVNGFTVTTEGGATVVPGLTELESFLDDSVDPEGNLCDEECPGCPGCP